MTETGQASIALNQRQANGQKQWVHLLPIGTFSGDDGRGPWHAPDAAAIVTASRQPNGRGLPIDYNHGTDLAGKAGGEAPAAGWIEKLEARRDGVWGLTRWTDRAQVALHGREYRFISPVFQHAPNGTVLRILRAALTNTPNLTVLTALNSAKGNMKPDQLLGALRDVLSLGKDADAQSVIETVRQLMTSRNTVDPARYVPMELFQQAVAQVNQTTSGISLQAAEIVVDRAVKDRQLPSWLRDWGIQLCTVNKPAYDKFVGTVGPNTEQFFRHLETPAISKEQFTALNSSTRFGAPVAGMQDVLKTLGISAEDAKKYGSARG